MLVGMRRVLGSSITIAVLLYFASPMLAQDSSTPPLASPAAPSDPPKLEVGKEPIPAPPSGTAAAAGKVVSIASSPPITLTLKTDLNAQRLTVLEGDTVLHVWPISSGLRDYATPTGIFQPQSANKMWYSRQYDWTPMPYAVFFTRGVAFHGTNATGRLGKSASHGCVRLATPDAEKLFELVHKHGFAQTRIIVFGSPKHEAPLVARLAPSNEGQNEVAGHKQPYQQAQKSGLPSWASAAFHQ